MKRTLLLFLLSIFGFTASGQTVLFSENFNSGSPAFTLNTTDLNSTSSGYNSWIVNNSYAGGNGSVFCLGFSFTFSVPPTPSQPAGIAGSPNSPYLHTVSDAAINNGISNCCFLAADGICNQAERYFTRMSNDVNTTGYDTVTLSFWWICEGGNNSYGEVYYSLNSGSSWTKITTPVSNYFNNGSWTQQVITLPVFANQPSLRFGFRFVNQVTTAASDPGFGIDDIQITGIQNIVVPVVNFTSNIQSFCEESCVSFTDLSTNNPTSWQWYFPGGIPSTSTQQNPLVCYVSPGSYDVTLVACNNNGCDSLTVPGFIQVNPNPPPPVISINGDTLCATFVNGYSYQWYYNINTLIPGAVNYCYIAVFPGSYHVIITDPNGCIASSDTIFITGINETGPGSHAVHIVTHAATGQFQIEVKAPIQEAATLEVRSMDGKLVFSQNIKPEVRILTGPLSSGVYSVIFRSRKLSTIKKAVMY